MCVHDPTDEDSDTWKLRCARLFCNPNSYTHNTQIGHIQRLVLGAHHNLGSTKSPLSISEHLGVTSH